MSDGFAKDYIPVAERIGAFYAKHPEGSLQSELIELSESRVVFRAYAYRTPEDIRPGIGYSSLEIPGRTPYTRGSEIENAETSAWGRAIAALGFEVKRGIASAEEIANKAEPASSSPAPRPRAEGRPPRPSAPTEPPEFAAAFGSEAQEDAERREAALGGMSTRALLSAADNINIGKERVAETAEKLWGKRFLNGLTDEQRAAVWEELRG